MTILLIYLTAPQVFTFMWTRASWNLEWMSVQKTFQKSMHFLLLSLSVTEIHGHLFCGVSGLYHYFLLYLNLPESLKYMVIFSLGFGDFIVTSSCIWICCCSLQVFVCLFSCSRFRTVEELFWKHYFENTPAPFPLGFLTYSVSPLLQFAWLHNCKSCVFTLFSIIFGEHHIQQW